MNEQKIIKKQLIKNMFYTFIVFTVILIFFDVIIYNQTCMFLYKSIDEELIRTTKNSKIISPRELTTKKMSAMDLKINPRLIYIVRDNEGNITNSDSIGRVYKDYLYNISFDKNSVNKIYFLTLQNTYNFRGITIIEKNEIGENIFVQLLANVDGETEMINNLRNSLLIRKCNNCCNINDIFICVI